MSLASLPAMLRCLRASRVLQAYLDGEADELTARHVAGHLEDCRRCGMKAATYRAIKRALRAAGGHPDELALRRLHTFTRSLGNDDGER
jgi:hypothetical protein